jgi:hypothetical protein
MQAGNLQAQDQVCNNCVSEDIKAVGIDFVVAGGATCLNANQNFSGELKITIDVTSNTRYGFWIVYDVLKNGQPFLSKQTKCFPYDYMQGEHILTLQTINNVPAGTELQIVNVLTAWDNNDPNGPSGSGKYLCERPASEMTCRLVTPKCKYYPTLTAVTVQSKPVIDVQGPADGICAGQNAVFTLFGTASKSPEFVVNVYYSTVSAAGPFTKISNFDGTETVTINNPPGNVTMWAYSEKVITGITAPCVGDPDNFTIVRNMPATATVNITSPVCASEREFPVSVTSNVETGSWSTSGTGTFDEPTSKSAYYQPSTADKQAGTVTLTWTTADPAGPCPAAMSSKVITIDPIATANGGGVDNRCESASLQIFPFTGASIGGSATTGSWSRVSGEGYPRFTGPTTRPDTVTYAIRPNTYGFSFIEFKLTTNDPEGPCGAASAFRIVTVYAKATAVASVETPRICQNQRTKISVESNVVSGSWSGGSGTYWSAAIGGSVVGPTSKMAYYQPSPAEVAAAETNGTTVVNLKWTTVDYDGDGPCTAVESNTISITIQALPMANAGPDKETCAGTPVEVKGMVTKGAYSSVKWTAPSGQFSNNGTTLTTTYTPSITSGTVELTLTVTPSAPCTTPQIDKVIITVSQCVGFCTYTQGYFGQDVGNGRAHYLVGENCTSTQAFATILAALKTWEGTADGGMKVGNMLFKSNDESRKAITTFLPGGGPAAIYTGSNINALTSSYPKNVLLSQTIALGLNMGLNPKLKNYTFTETKGYLKLQSSDNCGKGGTGDTYCLPYDVSMIPNSNGDPGIQVEDIWKAANRALLESGFGPKSAIAGAAGFINEAFDECAVVIVQSKENPCGDTEGKINPESLMLTETFTAANNGAAMSLAVKAFPNPFKDRVTIQFTAPVSGKAVVEFFDMTGRRLEMINKGQVVAGRVNTVDYMVPAANRNAIIYKVTVDNFSVNGRLISPSK